MLAWLSVPSEVQTVKHECQQNNDNNKQILYSTIRSSFRGAGARQRVSEQRKRKKPRKRECLQPRLKTVTESLLRIVFGIVSLNCRLHIRMLG